MQLRVRFRIYGAIISIIVMLISIAVIFMQENWKEMWVALAFLGAFSGGMVIYIKSNYHEMQRLTLEKAKKKGKTDQHRKKK